MRRSIAGRLTIRHRECSSSMLMRCRLDGCSTSTARRSTIARLERCASGSLRRGCVLRRFWTMRSTRLLALGQRYRRHARLADSSARPQPRLRPVRARADTARPVHAGERRSAGDAVASCVQGLARLLQLAAVGPDIHGRGVRSCSPDVAQEPASRQRSGRLRLRSARCHLSRGESGAS